MRTAAELSTDARHGGDIPILLHDATARISLAVSR